MLLKSTSALCFGLVLVGIAAAPANAQSTKQRGPVDATRYTERGEDGRLRTRIIVQKRSFLDGGTEVLPGTKDPNPLVTFGYSPLGSTIEGTNYGGIRHPLPSPYDLR